MSYQLNVFLVVGNSIGMSNSTGYPNETQTESIKYSSVPIIIEGVVLVLASLYVMTALILHRVRSRKTKIVEVMAASGSVKIKRSKICVGRAVTPSSLEQKVCGSISGWSNRTRIADDSPPLQQFLRK